MTGGRDLQIEVDEWRRRTDRRVTEFATELSKELQSDFATLIGTHTCVYTVGSAGRGELTAGSDLDLFLVRTGRPVSQIDTVLVQAGIIRAGRAAGFPEPSRDGHWLTMHSGEALSDQLGDPRDDPANTFTARMLLMLESRAVLGDTAYNRLIGKVIDRYWRDDRQHTRDFQPILLVNDIVRYWRTLLLNYEADIHSRFVKAKATNASLQEWESERALRSYKLGFSRCLTCYSALAYLLALRGPQQAHVSKSQVKKMVLLSPLERLLWVRQSLPRLDGLVDMIDSLVRDYLEFLSINARGKTPLLREFRARKFRAARFREKRQFGQTMFTVISKLGDENPLMRWLVV